MLLTGERLERYEDFKRGWAVGAQGLPEHCPGGPPKYRDEFAQGYHKGLAAYNVATSARFLALLRLEPIAKVV